MKNIGIILIVISFLIGCIVDYLPKEFLIEPLVGLAFGYFLLGIYAIILDKNCPKDKTPKKCICNDIEKQSTGGRCEACYSKEKDGGSDLSSFIRRPEIPKDRIG